MTKPRPYAIAWATTDAVCVDIPLADGSAVYTVRYPRTTAGLADALNILIQHAEPILAKAPDRVPEINSHLRADKPAKPKPGTAESRSLAADIVRRMFGKG